LIILLVPLMFGGIIQEPLALADSGTIQRVSVSSAGVQGNNSSWYPSLSSDGRYVAFDSLANNLIDSETINVNDVFVRDRNVNTTTRVSIPSEGGISNGHSSFASISGDGRYVAFESSASNMVSGDGNGYDDVFVRDRTSGTTTRISIGAGGIDSNDASGEPSLSSDGRYAAFQSNASNLVSNDNNGATDVFVRERNTGITTRISVGAGGAEGNGASSHPSISSNGRYATFSSYASNLVSNDNNGASDVFVRDCISGVTTMVSVSSSGDKGNAGSFYSAISNDGRYVAFESNAYNLVSGDTNGLMDVFVRDLTAGTTTRVSVSSAGAQANDYNSDPSISGDGRYVAFRSGASNLASNDNNGATDIFVRDRTAGITTRVSVSSAGAQANGDSLLTSISGDGCYVAFVSGATNLVADDTNFVRDVFVTNNYSSGSGHMTPVSGNWNGAGVTEIGAYLNGAWYLDYNGNGAWNGMAGGDKQYSFGSASMTPVTGDWNNDGRTEIGAYLNGTWYLDYNGNGAWNGAVTDRQYSFGSASMKPVTGNWDGAGGTEIGAYLNGTWYIDYNGNGAWNGAVTDRQYSFGSASMTPVTGDWNNDGKTEIGAYLNGTWYLDYNGNGAWNGVAGGDRQYSFGSAAMTPVTGNWNGAGGTEIGAYLNGTWYLDYNGTGAWNGTGTGKDRQYSFGN